MTKRHVPSAICGFQFNVELKQTVFINCGVILTSSWPEACTTKQLQHMHNATLSHDLTKPRKLSLAMQSHTDGE